MAMTDDTDAKIHLNSLLLTMMASADIGYKTITHIGYGTKETSKTIHFLF
jgi:hypothetical protein